MCANILKMLYVLLFCAIFLVRMYCFFLWCAFHYSAVVTEGEHFFLDTDTKLHKVAPEGWKEGPRGQAIPITFTVYVRIKFYPDALTDFR